MPTDLPSESIFGKTPEKSSPMMDFVSALQALAEHNRISDSDDHLAHPSPCFECEVQKLLSRCVEYGQRLRSSESGEPSARFGMGV